MPIKRRKTSPLTISHPQIAMEANGWDPSQYFAGSSKKMSWICPSGHGGCGVSIFSYVEALFSVALSLLTEAITLSNESSMLIVAERESRITRSGW